MNDSQKTKKQLIEELSQIRRELASAASPKNGIKKNIPASTEPDNLFYKTFLSSPDMFIIADPTNGIYVEVNDSFVENTGYSREELIGHRVEDINLWAKPEERDKMSRLLAEQGKLTEEEFSFRMKSGEIRLWLCSAEIVNIDGTDRMIAIAIDITERKKLEENLARERRELSLIIDSSPEIVFYKDREGRFIRVNKAFADSLHIPEEEFVGKTVFDLYSTEIAQGMTKDDQEVFQSGRPKLGITEQYESASGIRWVQTDKVPIYDKDGSLVGLIGFAQDITERKQAEEALRLSEENYRDIFELSPDGIVTINTKGVLTSCNTAFSRLTGFSKEVFIGKHFAKIPTLRMKDIPKYLQLFTSVLRKKELKPLELRWIHKDGTERLGEFRFSVMKSSGKISGIQVIARDITERKQMEENLRYHADLTDNVSDAIVSTDLDHKIISWNKAAETKYGWRADEVIGEKIIDIIKPEYPNTTLEEMMRTLRTDGIWHGEAIHETKESEKLDILVSTSLIKDEKGNGMGAVAVFTDITERKQEEERHQTILRTTRDGVWAVDLNGKFVEVNDSYCNMMGYTREELLDMSITDVEAIETSGEIQQRINKITKEGGDRFETKHTRKDGRIIDVEISTNFLDVGVEQISVFVRDITERKEAEEALRESEELRSAVFNSTPNLAAVIDEKWTIIDINEAMANRFGKHRDELIGIYGKDLLPQELAESRDRYFKKVFKTGKPCRFEDENSGMYFDNIAYPVLHVQGETKRIAINAIDVTERKRAEEEFENIFNLSPDMMGIFTIEGELIRVNPSWEKILGYKTEELLKIGWAKLVHPDDVERTNKAVEEQLKGSSVANFTNRYKCKDGSYTTLEWQASFANEGIVYATARDITERKTAEEALRESEERFRTLFETMAQGVVYQNAEGKILSANPAAGRILGLTLDQIRGRTSVDPRWKSIHEDGSDLPGEQHPAMESLRTGQPVSGVVMGIYHPVDDEYRWISIDAVPEFREGEDTPYRVYTTFTDITGRMRSRETLRQSEEKFSKAFRSSPDRIVIANLEDAKIIEVNDSYLRFTGYRREEVIGRTTIELGGWIDPENRLKIVQKLKKQGRIYNEEVEQRLKSGEIRTSIFSAELINIDGEPCIISVANDITERKQAEEALRESNEYLERLTNSMGDAVFSVKMPEGVIEWVNDSFKLTGYEAKECIGKTIEFLCPDRNGFLESGNKLKKQMSERNDISHTEQLLKRKNGEVFPAEITATIIRNERGKVVGVTSIVKDITERKHAEEALRESEAELQGILRAAPIGIALIQNRVALWVNDYFCTMTGYSTQELVGVNAIKLYISHEEFLRVGELKTRDIELYGKGEVETQFVCKNGNVIDVLLISTPLNPEDLSAGVIATMMDITERKKAEIQQRETKNLRELDKLRTELLANVSHELRTPLASIKGFTTVLEDYDEKLAPEEKQEYLQIIDHNTDRLSELIEQLLVMSRLGAGMLTIDKSSNDINILCQEVISEAKIRSPEYQFTLNVPARLPKVHIDTKRIRQVLDNLIDNAVKNSSAGTEISVAARKSNGEIMVTVTDEGTGISRKDKPRIFDRMFHTERNHKPGVTGAGLGLSICKGLIEAHKGRIWIESEEGKGTRCFFTLPTYNDRGVSHGKKDKGQYHSMHRG